ncbi:MAG: hypothetical protein U0793_23885 [Gemmataceae bacterium]
MKTILAIIAVFAPTTLAAAPPKADYLCPAGGQRGQKVELTVGGLDGPAEAWASHPGISVSAGKKTGQFHVAIAPDVSCGMHWLRFFNKDGAAAVRPFLVNQIPEVMEQEPNDEPKKPQEIKETPVIVNGRLEKPSDTDVFAVSLKKGQTLVAAVEAHRLLRSPMDAVLQVLSEDGFILAQNDDFYDIDPLVAFPVPRDGRYLVRIFCFPAVADARVGLHGKENCVYRLTLTTGPFIDHAWPLTVERAKPGAVELIGWNIPADKGKTGVVPATDDDLAFVQPSGFANGTLVRVEPHACVTEGPLHPPVTVSGRLKGDKSVSLDLQTKKGQRLRFQIESRELFFPLDPVLILRDAAGKQLQRVQAAKLNADPVLDFTPSADAKHTLEVRDLHEEGGPRHLFRLRCLVPQPDFEATLATDRFTTAPGKPLEINVDINRLGGLKEPIELVAEGLGEVKQEQLESKDAKKAGLRLSGLKAPQNAPFRLYARIKGREETRRAVTATLADLDSRTPHLWLTVSGK